MLAHSITQGLRFPDDIFHLAVWLWLDSLAAKF